VRERERVWEGGGIGAHYIASWREKGERARERERERRERERERENVWGGGMRRVPGFRVKGLGRWCLQPLHG
jgi:hypothetical protein